MTGTKIEPQNPYINRFYRAKASSDLHKFHVEIGESDLWILANENIKFEIDKQLKIYRRQLKEYIYQFPVFKTTFKPYPEDINAPQFIQWMIRVSAQAGVGPMASVAGAIAAAIGKSLQKKASELIIENGGDIYLHSNTERLISIFAGKSVISMKLGIIIPPHPKGFGICTSAGTVGPSVSFGKADAAVILAPDTALADAVATAVANRIQTTADLSRAVDFAQTIPGITGVVVIKDDKMAAWGDINLVPTE